MTRIAAGLLLITVQTARSTWDGVYTQAQADRGRAVYAQKCERCHQDDLSGEDEAPPLAGLEFNAVWNTLPLNDLFDRVRTGMPPDKPGSMTRQDVADVLAYMLAHADFPIGSRELPHETDNLKAITFLAAKPK